MCGGLLLRIWCIVMLNVLRRLLYRYPGKHRRLELHGVCRRHLLGVIDDSLRTMRGRAVLWGGRLKLQCVLGRVDDGHAGKHRRLELHGVCRRHLLGVIDDSLCTMRGRAVCCGRLGCVL